MKALSQNKGKERWISICHGWRVVVVVLTALIPLVGGYSRGLRIPVFRIILSVLMLQEKGEEKKI